jgi:3'-phosphoadenosine 5'-phosphosulfate sulfotransferase
VQLYSGKRTARHLEFGTPFSKRLRTAELSKKASSQEPCRNKFILGETEVRPEVLAGRQAAAEEQAALVRSKMSAGNSRMRPCKGSYYVRKQERHLQVKWKEAVEGARPDRYTHNQVSTLLIQMFLLY